MAGHSKWANIKHRKAAQDKKRGSTNTKLIRAVTVAAKNGGDPDASPALRLAMDKAFKANISKDTIDRAIKRGLGDGDASSLEEVRYEGYAPGGVAVLVYCLTDNRNRTVGEVRHAFTKAGGNLGTDGSVSYLFKRQGLIILAAGSDEEKAMEIALENGAEDINVNDDGTIDITTSFESFDALKKVLELQFTIEHADIMMNAAIQIKLDSEAAEKISKMIDVLEDLDDVQEVFTNAEF